MLKIDVLVASMNYGYEKNSKLFLQYDNVNYIIVNQLTNPDAQPETSIHKRHDIQLFNYIEKGLSKSRNRAIESSTADICLIADDDVCYIEKTFEEIIEVFTDNPNIDVLTFMSNLYSSKWNNVKSRFRHDMRTVMKVTSWEIAFRRKAILDKNIKFDTIFGLGAQYPIGEENIFLLDCVRKKLLIEFYPEILVFHPVELTTGDDFTTAMALNRGAVFARMFSLYAFAINLLFIIKKSRNILKVTSLWDFFLTMCKGSWKYIRNWRKV